MVLSVSAWPGIWGHTAQMWERRRERKEEGGRRDRREGGGRGGWRERKERREGSEAGRVWGEEEKGTTEDEMAGWHH